MNIIKTYDISFVGLKQGSHLFEYQINKEFFDYFDYDEFNEVSLLVKLEFIKQTTLMKLVFDVDGIINLNCDSSNKLFDLPIKSNWELVIKFGEEYNDDDDELLIIPFGEYKLNVAKYIHEIVVLAIPMKRNHPKLEEKNFLSNEMLLKLNGKVTENNKEKTDPRWDKLKNLLGN